MTVTLIGKFLVFVNLVFSLMLAALAVGIVTNRIDWAGTAAPGEREGVHKQRSEEVQVMREAYVRSWVRWKAEYDALAKVEKQRPEDQIWYADQMELLKTGKDRAGKAIDPAIQTFVQEADGRLKRQRGFEFRPEMVKHPDERFTFRTGLFEQLAEQEELIKQEEDLTLTLNGDKGKKKGLRDLLAEILLAQQRSQEELDIAKEESINGQVEAQSLLNRQRELLRRLEELKNIGVAAGKD